MLLLQAIDKAHSIVIPNTLFGFLWNFVRPYLWSFTFMAITVIVWSINNCLCYYFIKQIINNLSSFAGETKHVWPVVKYPVLKLIGLWFLFLFANRAQGFLSMYLFPKYRANIRQQVYAYTHGHSQAFFSTRFAGNIAYKLNDLPRICESIIYIFYYNFLGAFSFILISSYFLWQANHMFFWSVLAWVCSHLGVTLFFAKRSHVLFSAHAEALSTLTGKIVDGLANIASIHLFSNRSYENEYLHIYQQQEVKKAEQAYWSVELMKLVNGILTFLLVCVVIYLLIYCYQLGWVTLGDFSLISMLVFSFLGELWNLSFQITQLYAESGRLKSALLVLRYKHDIVDDRTSVPIRVVAGGIVFKSVDFAYDTNRVVFKQLSVVISPGEKVGLVGLSGAGKTTFVNLILRMLAIQSGEICIDGQNILQVTQTSLRDQIAMIPQDPCLFNRSLLDNIRYGMHSATKDEVIAAAKKAHCHDFIVDIEGGYQALVGERGINLSGGQRQRIAIARAILKNAPIVIQDEATSSLDSITETKIQSGLKEVMHTKTCLVIAHRLSTLLDLERILVFKSGQIIEEGSHANLLAKNGHYAELWNMQTAGVL